MDSLSVSMIAPILDEVRSRRAAAAVHAVGGIPSPEDMAGIYRRVARNHRCTPHDVQRWWEAVETVTEKEPQA